MRDKVLLVHVLHLLGRQQGWETRSYWYMSCISWGDSRDERQGFIGTCPASPGETVEMRDKVLLVHVLHLLERQQGWETRFYWYMSCISWRDSRDERQGFIGTCPASPGETAGMRDKVLLPRLKLGGSNPIFAHPQILILMCLVQKWGKKYMEREGKIIGFNTLPAYYYHCFLHIKLDISCYILHDSVMTVSR